MDLVFTPASILDLLSQIDELQGYELRLTETDRGSLQLKVGDSTYEISEETIEEVEAPVEVVDTIENINEDAYEDLLESSEFESNFDTIKSGIVKEAIKSLLLGGAIKLIKKLL